MCYRLYRRWNVGCAFAVLLSIAILSGTSAQAGPPIWDYEVLPSAYDSAMDDGAMLYGSYLKAVENKVTGQPALFWRVLDLVNSLEIFYFAQRTSNGWPASVEVVETLPMYGCDLDAYDYEIDSEGTPAIAYSVYSHNDPVEDGWTRSVCFKRRTPEGWPEAPTIVDTINIPWSGYPIANPTTTHIDMDFGPLDEPSIVYNVDYYVWDLSNGDDERTVLYTVAILRDLVLAGSNWELVYNEQHQGAPMFYGVKMCMDERPGAGYVGNISRFLFYNGVGWEIDYTHQTAAGSTSTSWSTPVLISSAGALHSMALNPLKNSRPGVVMRDANNDGNFVVYYSECPGSAGIGQSSNFISDCSRS